MRIDAIERVGELLDAFVDAGATTVTGVRFDLKDRAGAEREALRMAVADARARADAIASAAGRSIDRVFRISDTPQPRFKPMAVAMERGMVGGAAPETPAQGGRARRLGRLDHSARLRSDCSADAFTKRANSGCGAHGRDLNSGWN